MNNSNDLHFAANGLVEHKIASFNQTTCSRTNISTQLRPFRHCRQGKYTLSKCMQHPVGGHKVALRNVKPNVFQIFGCRR